MEIHLDEQTKARISDLAAMRNVKPEQLAAEWLAQVSKHQAEGAEDLQRLAGVRDDGGIPHDDMMTWLDELAAGNNV